MQSEIKLNFDRVEDYRRAVGRELLSRLPIEFSRPDWRVVEVGPGPDSELVLLSSTASHGAATVFIEPDEISAEKIAAALPKSEVFRGRVEHVSATLGGESFDLIYANFSLHWSENLSQTVFHLARILKPGGKIAFTITDPSRSFWALVNTEFKKVFVGCDLFNIENSHSLSMEEWKNLFADVGLDLESEIVFSGTASRAESSISALSSFKKACGPRYLRLVGDVTVSDVETWLLSHLETFQSGGAIAIPASGSSLIFSK